MNTEIKNAVTAAGANAQYDACVKRILGQKSILARILIRTVSEFHGMNPEDVIPLIDADIQIGTVPVDPGLTNAEDSSTRVIGFNTENSEIREGLIRFDIVFYVRMKSGKTQFIINLEAQQADPQKYDILNRGIFYVSQLISSQKERDFIYSNYDDIKNVYSIWICMNLDENCMNHIHLADNKLMGQHTWKGNLDLFNIVMIGLTDQPAEYNDEYELHRLLSAILSNTLTVNDKLKIMKKEYHIPVEDSFREDVRIMCNLGEGIEERATKKGIEKGKAEVILYMSKTYSTEDIANMTGIDASVIKQIIEENQPVAV